ncbi:MAG TPA: prephenate dehydrogenase [Acidothermaceae bacterium]
MPAGDGEPETDGIHRVLIVGAGLIGTSIGLALRQRFVDVALEDRAPGRLALATELGAGRPSTAGERFDVAVVAVPPAAVASELLRLQRLDLARTYTDVASAKAEPQQEAKTIGVNMSTYVGGHPVAGRERSGPAAAHADLFVGRPWVVTTTRAASEQAVTDVDALARACGAVPVAMTADDHDAALATVSHLPHLVASLLAAQLVSSDEATVALGGTGLHDTTRVAAGDPDLWTQILLANADHLATALSGFAIDVARTVDDLQRIASGDRAAATALTETLRRGAAGRARVPVKRGQPAAGFVTVPIVVRDAPGELALVLRTIGDAGINLEDVRVEHEPGRARGVVEIDVREDAASKLISVMQEAGWEVYS